MVNLSVLTRIDAMVLAAGRSTRTGSQNKLLLALDGKPLVAHVVDATLASSIHQVHVITGYQRDDLKDALGDRPVRYIHNPVYHLGMGSSINSGVRGLSDRVSGVILCLADMPWVHADHIDQLIKHFSPEAVCAPYFDDKRGHPVLFPKNWFARLSAIEGDTGARQLLEQASDQVIKIQMTDNAILRDINHTNDLIGQVG